MHAYNGNVDQSIGPNSIDRFLVPVSSEELFRTPETLRGKDLSKYEIYLINTNGLNKVPFTDQTNSIINYRVINKEKTLRAMLNTTKADAAILIETHNKTLVLNLNDLKSSRVKNLLISN